MSDTTAIQTASLPATPTEAQLDSYLNQILDHIPEAWDSDARKLIQQRLAAIGQEGLPALLRRLPLADRVEYTFVRPVLRELVTHDHLPALREALRRGSDLFWLFREEGWEEEARTVLAQLLKERRQPLPPAALASVAAAKDPATYEDLTWHFVRLRSGHDDVIPTLQQCPDFNLSLALGQAWKRVRLGLTSGNGLLLAAAAEGLPGAIDMAIMELETRIEPRRRGQYLAALAEMTGQTRRDQDPANWLLQHLGQFRFDAASRRYLLNPP